MFFFDLLISVILPIFLLIVMGALLDHLFDFDVQTLTRINFYVLSTILVLDIILRAELSGQMIGQVGAAYLVQLLVLAALALLVFSHPRFRSERTNLTFGTVFNNAGNYGIPLMLLLFGEQAVAINAIQLIINTTAFYGPGVIFSKARGASPRETLVTLLKVPVLHALWIGLLLRALHVELPPSITTVMRMSSDGFIPLALIALGAQLRRIGGRRWPLRVALSGLMRLLISPALMYLIALIAGFTPELRLIMTVSTAVPTAVTTYILSMESDLDSELASQIIALTTICSIFTVPLVTALSRL